MPANNNFVSGEEFREAMDKILEKLKKLDKMDKVADQLDWFCGKYTKLEEEQTIISGKVIDHGERIETLEKKVGIYAG